MIFYFQNLNTLNFCRICKTASKIATIPLTSIKKFVTLICVFFDVESSFGYQKEPHPNHKIAFENIRIPKIRVPVIFIPNIKQRSFVVVEYRATEIHQACVAKALSLKECIRAKETEQIWSNVWVNKIIMYPTNFSRP